MALFKRFTSKKDKRFDEVELSYSWMQPKPERWFCRVWFKDWRERCRRQYIEAEGAMKFEAYRKAVKKAVWWLE